MESFIIIVAVIAFIAVAVAEEMIASQWKRAYFHAGIPVYKKRGPLRWIVGDEPLAAELNRFFSGDRYNAPLMFKCIAPNEITFRDNLYAGRPVGWRWPRVIHVLIRLEPNEHTFTMTGYLNWSVPAMLLALAIVLLEPTGITVNWGIGITGLALAVLFGFSTIAPFILQLMTLDQIGRVIESFTGS